MAVVRDPSGFARSGASGCAADCATSAACCASSAAGCANSAGCARSEAAVDENAEELLADKMPGGGEPFVF